MHVPRVQESDAMSAMHACMAASLGEMLRQKNKDDLFRFGRVLCA
jgi:hypothetical protein